MTNKELIDAYVRQFVRANREIGMPPSAAEIERARIEATELVEKGDIKEEDLKPTRYDITETQFCKFEVYTTPREL